MVAELGIARAQGFLEAGEAFVRGADDRARHRLRVDQAMQELALRVRKSGIALRFVERATFRVGADNIRSRKAMGRIGGVLLDRVDMVEYRGRQLPHVVFEITREGFAGGPLASA